MIKSIRCLFIVVVLSAAHAETVFGQVGPLPDARTLTGTCTTCHGTQGRSAGGMPNLAGLDRTYVVEQMKRFREGSRPATIMHQIARGYTDEQTERLADHFARQTPGP